MHPVVITCIVSFMSVLDILLVLREVEETSLLSESERMLSKTILVPGANHAQVNIGIHATWLKMSGKFIDFVVFCSKYYTSTIKFSEKLFVHNIVEDLCKHPEV